MSLSPLGKPFEIWCQKRRSTADIIHEILANDRHWFLLFTVPSSLGLATLILYVARKIASKKLEDLAGAFNTTVVMRFFQGPYISVYHDGVENRIGVTTGGRNSPPYLILKQLTPLGFALSISKENPMTRGLGSIGLFKDVEVGDPAFDEKYLIRSNDPIRAQSFFQDMGRREITEYLFEKGFRVIKADNEAFMIMKPYYEKEDLMQEQILPLLQRMRELASG